MEVPSSEMLAFAIPPVLAHQGGWDELIVLIAPVLLFAVIRLLEKRRRPPADEAAPSAPVFDGAGRVREKSAQPSQPARVQQQPHLGL